MSAEQLFDAVKPVLDAVGRHARPPGRASVVRHSPRVGGRRRRRGAHPPLHGALDRLIESVESDLGGRLGELRREDKQRAVRLLHERGAFVLRKAVDDIADRMQVSRITVYNYLNAITR